MDIYTTITNGWVESIGGWNNITRNGQRCCIGDQDEWMESNHWKNPNGPSYYTGLSFESFQHHLRFLFFDRTYMEKPGHDQNSCLGRINFVNGSRKISEGTISIPDTLDVYRDYLYRVGRVSMVYFKNYYKNNKDIRDYEKWNKFF